MPDLTDTQIHALLGDDGLQHLVAAFYRRVKADDILGPMYPKEDLAGAEHRLGEFLIQRFGGPGRYSAARGHPRLRMRHAPFHIDVRARHRWIELMEAAMMEAGVPDAAVPVLRKYFADTATFMINVG